MKRHTMYSAVMLVGMGIKCPITIKNKRSMKEELWEILRDLEMGKISVNYANDRILRLFGVVGRSEQLKAFVTEVSKGFDDSHKHKVVKKANDILKSL